MGLPFPLTPVSILNLLAWMNDLTLFSTVQLPSFLQREPLIIRVDLHVGHGTLHLDRASI